MSRTRSILRWVAPCLLAAVLLPSWVLYFSGGMRAVTGWIALITAGQVLAPLSGLALLVHGIRKRRFSRPMQVTCAFTVLALWPGLWGLGILPMKFPFGLEDSSPAATVRLPSNQVLRVAWGGDRIATNYHAFAPDQRWAYDLLVEPALHGSERLEDYGCYGTPVVAPVSARVHFASDGAPDEVPGKASMNRKNPAGNSVVLELETGTHLILAHLRPNSVLVKPGDEVAEGDQVGECGNSGNSSEPHIHIHHQRQDPSDRPINFSEGLPLYFRGHDGDPMPEGGVEKRDGKLVLAGATVRHVGPAEPAPPE